MEPEEKGFKPQEFDTSGRSEKEHIINERLKELFSSEAKEIIQKKIDSMARDCVNDVLDRSMILHVPTDYHYISEWESCSLHLPSECPLILCPSDKVQRAENLKAKRKAFKMPTIEKTTPVTCYFPDSEDKSSLEPCLKCMSDCAAMNYARVFTKEMGRKAVEELISSWNLPSDWKHSIKFVKRSEVEDASRFKYSACFSKPVPQNPVPEAVARIYLTVSVWKIPSERLYSISYVIEGSDVVRTENLLPAWLENVIEVKKKLSTTIQSLELAEKNEQPVEKPTVLTPTASSE